MQMMGMKHDRCAKCNTESVCEVTVNAKCNALMGMKWSDCGVSLNSSSPNRTNVVREMNMNPSSPNRTNFECEMKMTANAKCKSLDENGNEVNYQDWKTRKAQVLRKRGNPTKVAIEEEVLGKSEIESRSERTRKEKLCAVEGLQPSPRSDKTRKKKILGAHRTSQIIRIGS